MQVALSASHCLFAYTGYADGYLALKGNSFFVTRFMAKYPFDCERFGWL